MSFDALLGNERLKERLSAVFEAGKATHCYLITGPSGSGRGVLAGLLMAALECEGSPKPCGRCSGCRKVLNQTHPDIITVNDTEHRDIPVKLVRAACSDLYIRPNEGNRKIYFFPEAERLNRSGQNTLLKCIEEPPAYGAFIFVCEQPEQLLPTIRSRSVELRMAPLPPALLESGLKARFPLADAEKIRFALSRSAGYLGQAIAAMKRKEKEKLAEAEAEENHTRYVNEDSVRTENYVNACCSGSPQAFLRLLIPLEKQKKEDLLVLFEDWHSLLFSALSVHHQQAYALPEAEKLAASCSESALLSALDAVREAQTMLNANVGTAHVCGALAVRLQQK